MRFGILHRMIFWELTKVFLLSLVGITGIIVLAAIVVEAQQRGLSGIQVLYAIPLIAPSMMPFIVPPTTLFASCVVYGRLAHDNEIIAIRAAGINVLYVVVPGVVLGLLTSAATLGLYYHTIPVTHHMLRTSITKDVEAFLYAMLKRDGEISGRPGMKMNYEISVESVQGRKLKWAHFKRRNKLGEYDVIAKAREAELHVDMERNEVSVEMWHGQILNQAGRDRVSFEHQTWQVELEKLDKSAPSARDMTWAQLHETREELQGEVDRINAERALRLGVGLAIAKPEDDGLLRYYEGTLRQFQLRIYGINSELQMRPALSCGCLFFMLVGCPVGIWFSRNDYLSAFITSFLPIVFVYYPLQLCSTNLAKDGRLNPISALWAANTVMGIMAAWMFRRLMRN